MKKIFISFAILAGVTLSGCNDSFLDKLPVTDPTEETVFKSYDNFLAAQCAADGRRPRCIGRGT